MGFTPLDGLVIYPMPSLQLAGLRLRGMRLVMRRRLVPD